MACVSAKTSSLIYKLFAAGRHERTFIVISYLGSLVIAEDETSLVCFVHVASAQDGGTLRVSIQILPQVLPQLTNVRLDSLDLLLVVASYAWLYFG